MIRAVVVLPTPRMPVSRNACAIRPVRSALASVRTSASWPISSDRRCGRWSGAPAPDRARRRWPPAVPRLGLVAAALSGISADPGGGSGERGEGSWPCDPARSSLRLLPSGPDRVGEWTVRRQLPALNIGLSAGRAQGARCAPAVGAPGRWHAGYGRRVARAAANRGASMSRVSSNPPPHRYAGAGLDRAAHRRLDAAWLSAPARRSDAPACS